MTYVLLNNVLLIDCLQSAFSLKILLILISVSAIAKHDVGLGPDEKRPSSRAYALVCRESRAVSGAVTLQREIRDCSQSVLLGEVFTLDTRGFSRVRREFSVLAAGRSREKKLFAVGLVQSVERLIVEREVASAIPGAGPFLRVLK